MAVGLFAAALAAISLGVLVAARGRKGADGPPGRRRAELARVPDAARDGADAARPSAAPAPEDPAFEPSRAGPRIRAVGVLGNSGESGCRLVRVARFPRNERYGGAAIAADGTLWLSGGDAVNRMSLSGELLERHALSPEGSAVHSRTFAVLDGTLYFFGETPAGGAALFALAMRPGERARALGVQLPPKEHDEPYVLAPQPLDGRLLVLVDSPGGERFDACWVDPRAARVEKAFSLEGDIPYGAAVDAKARVVYFGAGYLGAVGPDGAKVSDAFPIPCMKTPAIPTQFRGVVSLAGGALWDAAWYGFLSRHSTDGRNAPGRVVEWHHELDYPTQVLEVASSGGRLDAVLVCCATPAAWYLAHFDRRALRLEFVRRFGALPDILSLGLSEDGWVTVATARSQLWWSWDDLHDSPVRKADIHLAVTPPFFRGDACVAAARQYELANRSTITVSVFNRQVSDRNEARRVIQELPLAEPVGQAVRPEADGRRGVIYFTDAREKKLWATDIWLPDLRPDGGRWRTVTVRGTDLAAPTDIVALTDGRMLAADRGRVLMLAPDGEGFRLEWELRSWGPGEDERFGPRLRMAADGSWMLVSDEERHRVLWFDWTTRSLLGRFGETDRPGDDLLHLSAPTLVSLRGARAVVADAGNQRVLKMILEP